MNNLILKHGYISCCNKDTFKRTMTARAVTCSDPALKKTKNNNTFYHSEQSGLNSLIFIKNLKLTFCRFSCLVEHIFQKQNKPQKKSQTKTIDFLYILPVKLNLLKNNPIQKQSKIWTEKNSGLRKEL